MTLWAAGSGMVVGWYLFMGWTHPVGPPLPPVEELDRYRHSLLTYLVLHVRGEQALLALVALNTLVWWGYLGTVVEGLRRISGTREGLGWSFLVFLAFPHAWIPALAGPPRDSLTLFLMGVTGLLLTSPRLSSGWKKVGGGVGALLLGMQHAEAGWLGWLGVRWIARRQKAPPLAWWGIPIGILMGKGVQALFLWMQPGEVPLLQDSPMYRLVYAVSRLPWLVEILEKGGGFWLFALMGWAWALYLLLRPSRWVWLGGAVGVAAGVLDPTRVFALVTFWPLLVSFWGELPVRIRSMSRGVQMGLGLLALIIAFLPLPTLWSGVGYLALPHPWSWKRMPFLTHANPDWLCPLPPQEMVGLLR